MSVHKSGVEVSVFDGIQIIKFNNQKKNALCVEAYRTIKRVLEDAAKNEDVFLTVLTGEGVYYSSGFDITDPEITGSPEKSEMHLKDLIDALIEYPKLLIAVVNGPAIGLAVTILGHCDIVYASDKATFTTPFSRLGLCAEGCASYTLPRILGKSKASEMLYVGHVMSAKEALRFNFVSEVIPHNELSNIWGKIRKFKEVSRHSIAVSKKMTKDFDRAKLHEANQIEIDNLRDCTNGEDFGKSMMKFFSRKSKL